MNVSVQIKGVDGVINNIEVFQDIAHNELAVKMLEITRLVLFNVVARLTLLN